MAVREPTRAASVIRLSFNSRALILDSERPDPPPL